MDIKGLVEALIQSEGFNRVINNPLAQFGMLPERVYMGTEFLPEQTVPENAFVEEGIRYRTIIANSGTRYSPVQLKGGILMGSFQVILGNSDTGNQFTGADYDGLIRLIERTQGTAGVEGGGVSRPEMMAMASLTKWADATLLRPLLELNEKQRWDAVVNASVVRTGDNGYSETVTFPNPSGHRVTQGGTWSSNSYDPYTDIMAGAEFLASKGYTVGRMYCGTDVKSILALNAKIAARVGRLTVSSGNVVVQAQGRVSLAELNNEFGADGLPPLKTYDLQYRTATSSGYFLPRGTFVMVGTTGRDQNIDRGDLEPIIIRNALGYSAIGRPAGAAGPGRKIVITPRNNKPPRLEGESWQTSLPVITEPEAVFVISSIA